MRNTIRALARLMRAQTPVERVRGGDDLFRQVGTLRALKQL